VRAVANHRAADGASKEVVAQRRLHFVARGIPRRGGAGGIQPVIAEKLEGGPLQ
jgi:hypothetical protein